jgi:hypothetical protein
MQLLPASSATFHGMASSLFQVEHAVYEYSCCVPQGSSSAAAAAAAAAAAVHATAAAGSFLHTQGQDMPWFQVLMLDVLALYSSAAALACAVLVVSLQRVMVCCNGCRMLRCNAASLMENGSSRRKQD